MNRRPFAKDPLHGLFWFGVAIISRMATDLLYPSPVWVWVPLVLLTSLGVFQVIKNFIAWAEERVTDHANPGMPCAKCGFPLGFGHLPTRIADINGRIIWVHYRCIERDLQADLDRQDDEVHRNDHGEPG